MKRLAKSLIRVFAVMVVALFNVNNVLTGQTVIVVQEFYAGAGDEAIEYSNATESWSTIREASTGTATNYTSDPRNIAQVYKWSGEYVISRGFFPFDTSSIPAIQLLFILL